MNDGGGTIMLTKSAIYFLKEFCLRFFYFYDPGFGMQHLTKITYVKINFTMTKVEKINGKSEKISRV